MVNAWLWVALTTVSWPGFVPVIHYFRAHGESVGARDKKRA
jgi:hypothetical protein